MKAQQQEVCTVHVVHEQTVQSVRAQMLEDELLYDLAELFKLFGDTTRIKILWALSKAEMCVCDVAALIGTTQSAVSHQLRLLRDARLVKTRKAGKVVYYSLNDEHIAHIFDQGLTHVQE